MRIKVMHVDAIYTLWLLLEGSCKSSLGSS